MKKRRTIRLIYPQWQGGYIANLIPEVKNSTHASQGYGLGAHLLNFIAPKNDSVPVYTVPISMDPERNIQDGVYDRDIILRQTHAAQHILHVTNPDRIVTLGGECSVSVVPFTYLAQKYHNDVAVLWIDAHPDIMLPGDSYAGFHAMAVTACMGFGDSKIVEALPTRIPAERILFVGLRDWETDEIKLRQQEYGLKHLTVAQVQHNSLELLAWLKATGAKHVLIHFDMDVLEPSEIIPAVCVVPHGLRMDDVVRIITTVAQQFDLVGLTIAEPMPRTTICLREMLSKLPLLNEKLYSASRPAQKKAHEEKFPESPYHEKEIALRLVD